MKQSRRNRGFIFAVLIFALSFLISCGGGGGDGGGGAAPAPVKAPLSGIFKNSPVHGAFYETLTLTGQTSDAGAFSYREGEEVTFYVGKMNGLKLGSASGADVVTPVDLVPGAANVLSPRVTNISRLLQTLDEDGDLSNGIKINSACNTHITAFIASNSIDLSDTVDFEAKMTGLLVTLNADPAVFTAATPRALKTSAEARLQLETSIKGPVGEIQATTGAESIVADGSNAVAVQAAVANTEGDALIGVPVTFSATYGTLSSLTAYTNAYGVAEVMLTSGTAAGTAVVTASSGGFTDIVDVQFTSGAPAAVTVTATPSTVNPGGASSLTARVVDGNGNAVVGETVTVDITTNASGGSLSAISGTTNINGDVTVTYTSGSGTGNDIIRFRAASNNILGTVTVAVDASAQVVGSLALSTGAASIIANGTSTVAVRAEVTDSEGTALSGVTVNFSATLGTLSAASAVTNASGIAEVTLTSGTAAGTASVTASASGFTDIVDVQFTSGAPAAVTVTATPSTVNPGGASSLTARVVDGNGNAVVGETVTVDITTNASGGSLSAISGTTNINGDVTVTYTSGSGTGNDIIRFRAASNNTAGTVTVTVDAGAQAALIKLSASPLAVRSDNSDSATITATVLDSKNAVVEGLTVQFEATGGQISASSAVTDAQGEATVTFSAGTVDPSNQVATVTGRVSTLSSMVPVRIEGSTVEMEHTTLTIYDDGSTTDTLTVTARDAASNPVYGVSVTLTVMPGTGNATVTPASGTTDVYGEFTATVTGTLAGDVTVETTALGDTAEKTYDVIASGTPVFEITSPPPEDPDDPKPYAMKTSGPPLSVTAQAPGLATVRFATSLGILTNTALTAGNVVDEPVVGGIATVTFTPTEAGLALIQAFDPDDPDTRDTRRIAITAPVGAAAFINLQPSATVVARNLTEMTNTVTIKATVMTTEATGYQVVKDAPVFFSLENPAGGGEGISPVVVYTDDKGEAKTTFTSGKLSSLTPVVVAARVLDEGSTGPLTNVISFNDNNPAADTITRADGGSFVVDGFEAGEKIRVKGSQSNDGTYIIETVAVNTLTLQAGESLATEAAAAGVIVTILSVADSTEITIGGTAGSVVIGVGTVIEAPDPAYYKLPMAVQVADHNGQGVKDAVVSLNLWPAFYRTGGWYDEDPKESISYASYVSGTFANEDVNENLIMEPGEDVNGDDFLTPPNSAGGSVLPTVTTDENGVATFELVYLKTNGRWITDRITASTVVLGTEVSSQRYVPLQILESDVTSGDLPATSPNAPYPLQFKIPLGGTTVAYPFPLFRGAIDATHDDTYTASEGSTVGNVYSFTDPGGHASGDVIEDTVTIQGWVVDPDLGIVPVYRYEPVLISIE